MRARRVTVALGTVPLQPGCGGESGGGWWGRMGAPLVLLAALLTAVATGLLLPASALELRRPEAQVGEWWRLLTCHWVHWSVDHLLWDALPLLALAWSCRERARQVGAALLAASLAIPASVWWLQPELAAYRGLSGLASALFTLAAMSAWRVGGPRLPALALLLLFAAKVAWEAATATTLFVDSAAHGFVPVPLAHLVGAACGGLVACWSPAPRTVIILPTA
jgi:rhomboid family GlyGly-CTERM serine protease